MTRFNLPDDVNMSMIPGNRDVDIAWENWISDGGIVDVCFECDQKIDCAMQREGREEQCDYIDIEFWDWYTDKDIVEWEGDY